MERDRNKPRVTKALIYTSKINTAMRQEETTNKIYEFIESNKRQYAHSEMPFLNKQLEKAKATKPYRGITILHNVPFTKSTLVKLGVLYAGGAELTVTSPSFMEADPYLVRDFVAAGGRWKLLHEIHNEVFDFHLDCAAELMSRIAPKIGTVEITGTGSNKYGVNETSYPVISVDQSSIKNLEGILGTGEAFVRAFETLTQEEIAGKRFMIFGYGKVGKGIAHYLKKKNSDVIVIDKSSENIQRANSSGVEAYLASEVARVEEIAANAFAIVTATGVKNAISDNYHKHAFQAKYLANMGGEDEFGYKFSTKEVMCDKRPINFFIENPTLMRYLDPVFYAHNQGVDILRNSNIDNGLHPFPEVLSEQVVNEWETIFEEKVKL